MAIAAGCCNGIVALAGKAAERWHCRPTIYALAAFPVAGIAAYGTTLGRSVAWDSGLLWTFGGVMGCLYLVAFAAMVAANRYWSPSLVWSAANMAFVMPILLSALFLSESMRPLDAVIALGIGIMLVGLAMGGAGAETKAGHPQASVWLRWGLLAAVFAANGGIMFCFKLYGGLVPDAPPGALIAAVYCCGALAGAVWSGRGLLTIKRAEAGCGLGAGTAMALAGMAMLGAMRLPAGAVFPVLQGVSLLSGVLLCAWVFGERLTARKLVALAVGLAAMILTRWR